MTNNHQYFEVQIHGYKNGHQLLFSSLPLNSQDQDTIDRLSDISGPLRPGEIFEPYLTCYPLPSESYFVIAKTFQDLSIPRAGCVKTLSVLVKMDYWETKSSFSYFSILDSLDWTESRLFLHQKENVELPKIKNPHNEIIEALFLEKRQPTIIYNSTENENVVIRLYESFWVSLKKSFAICTYSLGQRKISGKPFDLLFAPESARSRFSEWPGKHIEEAKRPVRHRYTSYLANSIFKSETGLFGNMFFGVSGNSDFKSNFNETLLRMNLIWNDLFEKVKNDENQYLAILGMLDIVNALPDDRSKPYEILYPYIIRLFQVSTIKLGVENSLNFLFGILARHKLKLMSRELFQLIHNKSFDLGMSYFTETINFLSLYQHPINTIPTVFFSGFGDGASVKKENLNNITIRNNFIINFYISLTASSLEFTKRIVSEGEKRSINILLRVLEDSNNDKIRAKLITNFAYSTQNEDQMFVLDILFNFCNTESAKLIFKTQFKTNKFSVKAFYPLLLSYIKKFNIADYVIALILEKDRSGLGDEFIIAIVNENPSHLRLILKENVNSGRLTLILSKLFQAPSTKLLETAQNEHLFDSIFIESMFSNDHSLVSFANILCIANIEELEALYKINQLPEEVFHLVNQTAMNLLINRSLLRIPLDYYNVLHQTFSYVINPNIENICSTILSNNRISANRTIRNLEFLFYFKDKFERQIYYNSTRISEILSKNLNDELSELIEISWIQLVYNAKSKESASAMLEFCYKCKSYDPSSLLLACFPMIYRSFQHGSNNFLLPFLYFSDWDKCRTLREDLVKMYLDKKWKKINLFKIANATSILNEIIHLLLKNKQGRKFIEQTLKDSFSDNENRSIQKYLNKIISKR